MTAAGPSRRKQRVRPPHAGARGRSGRPLPPHKKIFFIPNKVMLPTVHRIFSYPMGDLYRGDGRALLGAEDNLPPFEGVRYLLEAPRAKYR